jgi:hypothetical protein
MFLDLLGDAHAEMPAGLIRAAEDLVSDLEVDHADRAAVGPDHADGLGVLQEEGALPAPHSASMSSMGRISTLQRPDRGQGGGAVGRDDEHLGPGLQFIEIRGPVSRAWPA